MPSSKIIDAALAALDDRRCIVMPTDTVYGIAARPEHPEAIALVFALKGRPDDKPLPVLGGGIADLTRIARFDDRALRVASRWWPGPLTLVLPRASGFEHDLGGGPDASVAVRIPSHPLARELLDASGPLAVTSANRSGEEPAADVSSAREIFGDEIPVYLDGGAAHGRASTVLDLTDVPRVLRVGAIEADQLLRSTL
ncbi:MAG: L-threonylcarbamoyladenylate synthase [Actinomycetota bacterium]|nr:L-threonylcarbamoyladenylate synthase [Actinomycetota bacterium]